MSHPLLVMPLPFRTVRSLRRRSKDNTGLNLQGPDVNRESREQISGQHRGVRRSPWMPPSPLPAQNRVESGKIGFLRVESGIIGSGSSTRPPKSGSKGTWSPRALLGHKRPFYIKESWENLAGVSGLDSWPPLAGPQPSSQPVSAGFAGSRSSPAPDPEAGGLREPGGPRGARRLSERHPPRTPKAK